MIDFGESLGAWFLTTFVPALIGFLLVVSVGRRVKVAYAPAFAIGIFLWFFVDTLGGSANLDVNSGFGGGLAQLALVVLFAVGALAIFYLEGIRSSGPGSMAGGLGIALLAAVAVGIHGTGEGAAFGAIAASTPGSDLIGAFGGTTAGVAYVLHKALESMMVGAVFVGYSRDRPLKWGLLLALVFSIPSIFGFVTGYYLMYDASYLYALGLGTSLFAALKLASATSSQSAAGEGVKQWKLVLLVVFGFLCLYSAALLHS